MIFNLPLQGGLFYFMLVSEASPQVKVIQSFRLIFEYDFTTST